MVDFGNTIFEGRLSPSAVLQEPVQDKSTVGLLQGISAGLESFGSFLTADRANKADEAKNGVLSEVSEQMILYADARDQGVSTDEIMRNIRVKANEWVSNNPAMTEDIHNLINKMMSESGLAGNINKETPEETRSRKLADEAYAGGWGDNLEGYKRYKALEASNEVLTAEINAMLGDGKKLTAGVQAQATRHLHELVAVGLPWVNEQIKSAYTLLANTTDPIERQSIIEKTKETVNLRLAEIGNARSLSGNAVDTSYLTSGIETIMSQFEKVANGQATKEALQTQYDTIKLKADIMVNMDPKTATLYAMNRAVNFVGGPYTVALNDAQNKMLAQLGITVNADGTSSEKPPDIIDAVDNILPLTEALKSEFSSINKSPEATIEVKADATTQLQNVIRSVARYGAGENDPRNFNAVIDLLSDPSIGQFIDQNGGKSFELVGKEAADVVERQYSSVVIPLINERWATASTDILKGVNGEVGSSELISGLLGDQIQTLDINKIIRPVWNGAGIEFVVDDAWKQNANIRAIAKDLNTGSTSITGPLNKLIRATAHLSGTTDYQKVYEEIFAKKLWVTGEGKVNPDVELSDFSNIEPKAPIVPRPDGLTVDPSKLPGKVGKLLDGIGLSEGATYDTLYGYAEREGKAFAGTDITSMSISEIYDLQKQMVNTNGVSSAVGKYQFLNKTLKMAVAGLKLSQDTKFTPEIQDKLAVWLLRNAAPSFNDWLIGDADTKKFQDELARTWASIPDSTGKSYYSNDGINNASEYGKALVQTL